VVLPESENDPSVATRQYVLDEVLALVCNEQCELRMDEMDEMSLDGMSRMLCAFINTNGGEILYGIQPEWPVTGKATVRGMFFDQQKRDQFRLSFSKLAVQQITPPVVLSTITIHFWPVIHSLSREPVDDLFVLGIVIQKQTCLQPTLYTAISCRKRNTYAVVAVAIA